MHQLDILADRTGRGAVVTVQEVVHRPVHIAVRVPDELGQQVGPQFGELAADFPVALGEHALGAVLDKELHVGLQDPQVRERADQIPELRHVVPNEDVVAQFGPVFDILPESPGVGIGGQGTAAIALDVAQHDVHVRSGTKRLRRSTAVQVGERGNGLVGELRRDPVDEFQQGPHGGPFPLVDGPAIRALAIPVHGVALAHRPAMRFRVRGHLSLQVRHRKREDRGIRQAKLSVGYPLAVHQRKILWVVRKVLIRGHVAREGMAPGAPAGMFLLLHAAVFDKAGIAVQLVAGGKIGVHGVDVVDFAVRQDGGLGVVHRPYRDLLLPGNGADLGTEPAAAQVIFQERVHAVQRPAHRAAGDHKMGPHGSQGKALLSQRGKVDPGLQLRQVAVIAQQNLVPGQGLVVSDDR